MKNALLIALFIALGTTATQAGDDLLSRAPAGGDRINPYAGKEPAMRAGAKLYNRECASCHGENGIAKAPRLDSQRVREGDAGALFWILRNGSLKQGMPSFAHLSEAQRWEIITWLKEGPAGQPRTENK